MSKEPFPGSIFSFEYNEDKCPKILKGWIEGQRFLQHS